MQTVIIARNPIEPESWTVHETSDIRELLVNEFNEWPSTARIYHEQVSQDRDITPRTEAEVENLVNFEGKLYVVVYPGDPLTIIIAVVAAVAVAATIFLFRPQIPSLRNQQQQSPNNSLSERTNQARLGKRIPDIYGTVRSTPDLLTVPYKIFENNDEVEITYMCVGRGSYDISSIKDDTTLLENIQGSSAEVYGPGKSPKSGDAPDILIGDEIENELVKVKRHSAVNGQTLEPSNAKTITGSRIRFQYPNLIRDKADDIVWSDTFEIGDEITVSGNTIYRSRGYTVDLAGTYTVASFLETSDRKHMFLNNPAAVNSDWNVLDNLSGNETGSLNVVVSAVTPDTQAGPFDVDLGSNGKAVANFVALNGIYKDDGENKQAYSVTIKTTITPINSDGDVIGTSSIFYSTLTGSATDQKTVGLTVEFDVLFGGLARVMFERSSPTDKSFEGQVIDEVKVRDLYIINSINETEFGDVTTIYLKQYATEGALAVKDRKLNCLANRKVPAHVSGTTFGALTASNSAADIICAITLDEYIGGRTVDEIDVVQIYETIDAIVAYFGVGSGPAEFSYTFDDDQISFEESITAIARAVFCIPYRVGSTIRLSFEKATEDSVLLFNHRNKLPGSEKRTVSFGRKSDYDGVSYEYIDPDDDAVVTYYIPGDRSAVNPQRIESVGVRNDNQAYYHAWRIWNKINYQTTSVEFEATQEADLLVIQDRILVADNTRSDTQDGEVIAQDGLNLTLSQDVTFAMGVTYTIFLQHVDATIESIAITQGAEANEVVLAEAPSAALSLDADNFARATYQIVGNTDARNLPFLLSEKVPNSNFTVNLTAVNYDSRYYDQDDRTTHVVDFTNTTITFDNVCITWDNDNGVYIECRNGVSGLPWIDRSTNFFNIGAAQETSGTLTSFQTWFEGYIDSVRVTKGIARYTNNIFVVPSSEFPNDASDPYWDEVVTLLRFDGTNGATASTCEKGSTVTHNGGAALSTAIKKFGASSCQFDGTDDWIKTEVGLSNQALGETFTIEAWIYPTDRIDTGLPGAGFGLPVLSAGQVSVGGQDTVIGVTVDGDLSYNMYGPSPSFPGSAFITSSFEILPLNEWSHVSVCRDGATGLYYLHINGRLATD